jgi:hypothetical protein
VSPPSQKDESSQHTASLAQMLGGRISWQLHFRTGDLTDRNPDFKQWINSKVGEFSSKYVVVDCANKIWIEQTK